MKFSECGGLLVSMCNGIYAIGKVIQYDENYFCPLDALFDALNCFILFGIVLTMSVCFGLSIEIDIKPSYRRNGLSTEIDAQKIIVN